jgi:hypothetical protein
MGNVKWEMRNGKCEMGNGKCEMGEASNFESVRAGLKF